MRFAPAVVLFSGFAKNNRADKASALLWFSVLNCGSKKYLWALPTLTTFEKVDQTFINVFRMDYAK